MIHQSTQCWDESALRSPLSISRVVLMKLKSSIRRFPAAGILSLFNAGGAGKCHATTCALIPAGLVSWYPGENNANDIIGSNNGTLANGTAFAAGKVGQAFSHDGADDYVDLGAGFNLDQMALDAWVFIDPATNTGRAARDQQRQLSPSRREKTFRAQIQFALRLRAGWPRRFRRAD